MSLFNSALSGYVYTKSSADDCMRVWKIGGMTGRGNPSTLRNASPSNTLCRQIPSGLTLIEPDLLGGRLTAWAMVWPKFATKIRSTYSINSSSSKIWRCYINSAHNSTVQWPKNHFETQKHTKRRPFKGSRLSYSGFSSRMYLAISKKVVELWWQTECLKVIKKSPRP
jgi:hypothetical protein